ncbi:MAG: methyltransferase, TIGR04325 family [Bacteroidia bacterium]
MIKLIKAVLEKISPKTVAKPIQTMWSKPYLSWMDAKNKSIGYQADNIFLKVKESTLAVKEGRYPYERDSVLFDHIEYAWPLLSILQKIAIENENSLTIVDFGGSLGSTYFQNRNWLSGIKIKWIVIEQEQFVQSGKKEFSDEHLIFESSIQHALAHRPNAVLFSSVLQYLEHPKEVIDQVINEQFKYILIDRTSFGKNIEKDFFTVQTVPSEIYAASYPCRFFEERKFLGQFASYYSLEAEFPSFCDPSFSHNGITYYWKGFFLRRK